uniref:Uncharacterized protein n=1 Tax=Arundo donax TaxID=35708 RepID=A0A0A9FZH9_ARUDO
MTIYMFSIEHKLKAKHFSASNSSKLYSMISHPCPITIIKLEFSSIKRHKSEKHTSKVQMLHLISQATDSLNNLKLKKYNKLEQRI